MKLPRILIPLFAFVWELIPLFKIHVGYYIKGGIVHFENWTGPAGRPYICWRKYSPSPIFIVLVLLPALVLLASYTLSRESSLKNSGIAMLLSLLTAVVVPIFTPDLSIQMLFLILASFGSGAVLKKMQRKGHHLPLKASCRGWW